MNANTKATDGSGAWNPWPAAITAFFGVFIVCVVAFILFATRQRMDLVRPDYYEEEMRFQGQLDRLNRTQPLGSRVVVDYNRRQQSIMITLPPEQVTARLTGRIQLYRPSDASLDRNLQLAVNSVGVQQVDAKQLPAGLWKVRVRWTVNNEEYFVDRVIVVEPPPS